MRELLRRDGQQLNVIAEREILHALDICEGCNPWHVCFAVGLSWGHLADGSDEFVISAVRCLENLNDEDLKIASSCHYERGPEPIRQSLRGGSLLFSQVRLPATLPTTLAGIKTAQNRWLGRVLSEDRPRYIGSWNATAMFMLALFSQPSLARELKDASIGLPPGGPIHAGLGSLYRTHVISRPPEGNELDDNAFEPGAIFANTGLMAEIRRGRDDWSLLDVHSGIYMLGTQVPDSNTWF